MQKKGAETPRDYAREVVQTYTELYDVPAATELTPEQQQTCLQTEVGPQAPYQAGGVGCQG